MKKIHLQIWTNLIDVYDACFIAVVLLFLIYFEFGPFLFILTRTYNAAIILEMKLFQTAHIFVKKLTSQSSKQIMNFNSLPQLSYDTPSAIRHKFPSPQTIKQLR